MALPLFGETSPYRLPELLPPAKEQKSLNRSWGGDAEELLAYFEEHQATLSDYDRVNLLLSAARSYTGRGSHPRFKQSGPARALIELALQAARGAENYQTIELRRLRVQLAWRIHPDVGRRETDETRAEMEAILIDTVTILGSHGYVPNASERKSFGQAIKSWDNTIEQLRNPQLANRKVPDEQPRLSELPYQDPHTKSMVVVNPWLAHSYEDVHRHHVSEFVGKEGFGIARHVRNDQRQAYRDESGGYWRVSRAQLISFLEREEPVAYQMTEANERKAFIEMKKVTSETVPTRPLTEFENSAFKKAIQSGKPEIVESPTKTRMVAPILAEASCVRCHDLNMGDPLGAFSYEIEPDPSAAEYFEPRYQSWLEHQEKRQRATEKKSR